MVIDWKPGDITNIECKVIINSLGIDTTNYGGICRSILGVSKSFPELKKTIDSVNGAYDVGEMFLTSGYGTKAEHILHVITPHSKDDPELSLFKETIRQILNYCRYKKLYKVAIPSIGTGADGYDKNVTRKIIKDMCNAYCGYYPSMKIALVLPIQEYILANDRYLDNHRRDNDLYHDDETLKKFKKGAKKLKDKVATQKNKYHYTKQYFDYCQCRDEVELDQNNKKITTISKYVDAFIGKFDESAKDGQLKRRIAVFFGYGKNNKNGIIKSGFNAYNDISGDNTTNRNNLFKIIFALQMDKTEADNFLNHFGYAFAKPGVNSIDDIAVTLIDKNEYDLLEIDKEYKKHHINFFKNK